MSSIITASAALFLITAALCLVAELARSYNLRRHAAMLAVLTVAVADAAMLSAVPEFGLSWPQWLQDAPEHAKGRRQRRLLEHDGSGAERDRDDARVGTGNRTAPAAGDADDQSEDDEVEVIIEPARRRARSLLSGLFTPSPARTRTDRIMPWDTIKDCPECPEMVVLPAGETVVGAPMSDPLADAAEQPARKVRVWPGFAMARFEISTRELLAAGIGRSAAAGPCAAAVAHDAERRIASATCVTWNEAFDYVAWLARRTGHRYRLASAAEWEYAARLAAAPRMVADAGHAEPGRSADTALAPPLLALGGGVAEMVRDCWADTLENASETSAAFLPDRACYRRVLKDGSDREPPRWRRLSARRPVGQEFASPEIGFRVVRDLDATP